MSVDWGYTVPPDQGGGDIAKALAQAPPSQKLPPGRWARKNLFNTPLNSVITVVLGTISLYLAYRFARFVFVTGQWEPVRRNLELFMISQYPRDERWRIVAQLILMAGAIGAAAGSLRAASIDTAVDTGEPRKAYGWRTYVNSYWAVVLFVATVMGAFVRTIGPWLILGAAVVLGVVTYLICGFLPARLRLWRWTIAGILAVVSFQMVSGTGGWAWFFLTLALTPVVRDEIARLLDPASPTVSWALVVVGFVAGVYGFIEVGGVGLFGIVFLAAGVYGIIQMAMGDRLDAAGTGAVMIVGLAVYLVYAAIGLDGIDWEDWGGLHLTLVMTVGAILLAFPLGMLLALGRRSSLPAVRVMSVAYIELFRGTPLITWLLTAQFFLGFFLDSETQLSLITRAMVAITLFSAAYVAEIIRGGLQSVPAGQIEAGQAMGLSQAKIMRLIVMPQALRAVIPAMVGQFISLFKDTTLLGIIAINEFLGVRRLVHSQSDFLRLGIAETLVFCAFGFWAVAFTMSRESQRLERKLSVGRR
ncbi:MAG: amino acid ABC transporter permease [Acidimicrobiales bacterium]